MRDGTTRGFAVAVCLLFGTVAACDEDAAVVPTQDPLADAINAKPSAAESRSVASQEDRTKLTDERIERAVIDRLLMEGAFPGTQVGVDVENGVVTLDGKAFSLHEKKQAMHIVRTTKGVRSIVDRTQISKPDLPDREIRNRVEHALFQDPATEAYQVQVSVDDGRVTLSGEVDSWAEKRLAETVASNVIGVTGVENKVQMGEPIVRPDDEMQREIQRRLETSVLVDAGLLDVDVKSGVVKLSGVVGSAAERWYAKANAWVDGISRVDAEEVDVEWWDRERFRRDASDLVEKDGALVEAVQDALRVDPRVKAEGVEVVADRGDVTLSGNVPSLGGKLAAERTARNTVGVFRVRNHLMVEPGQEVNDDDLEKRIERAFDYSPYVDDFEGSIRVEDGYVTLSGTVKNHHEKRQAEQVAQRVQGVRYVENDLDVYWRKIEEIDLKQDVESELFWNVFVDDDGIDVAVEKGVVNLTGEVDDFRAYREASEAALDAGARAVVNRLQISQNSGETSG